MTTDLTCRRCNAERELYPETYTKASVCRACSALLSDPDAAPAAVHLALFVRKAHVGGWAA